MYRPDQLRDCHGGSIGGISGTGVGHLEVIDTKAERFQIDEILWGRRSLDGREQWESHIVLLGEERSRMCRLCDHRILVHAWRRVGHRRVSLLSEFGERNHIEEEGDRRRGEIPKGIGISGDGDRTQDDQRLIGGDQVITLDNTIDIDLQDEERELGLEPWNLLGADEDGARPNGDQRARPDEISLGRLLLQGQQVPGHRRRRHLLQRYGQGSDRSRPGRTGGLAAVPSARGEKQYDEDEREYEVPTDARCDEGHDASRRRLFRVESRLG